MFFFADNFQQLLLVRGVRDNSEINIYNIIFINTQSYQHFRLKKLS